MSEIKFNEKHLLNGSKFDVWYAEKFLGSIYLDPKGVNWGYYPEGKGSPQFITEDLSALKAEAQACWLDGYLEGQGPAMESLQSLTVPV